jgi:hypothetical protein
MLTDSQFIALLVASPFLLLSIVFAIGATAISRWDAR